MKREAFTLIEIVAAVAVASLILMATYGVITTTVRAQRRTEAFLSVYKEGSALLTLIEEDLSSIIERGEKEVNFHLSTEGEHTGFSFVSLAWDPQSGTRMAGEVGYEIESLEGELTLYRRYADIYGETDKGGTMTLVTDHLLSWKVALFDGKEWLEDWEEDKTVPVSVRVDFELAGENDQKVLFSRQVVIPASTLTRSFDTKSEEEDDTEEDPKGDEGPE